MDYYSILGVGKTASQDDIKKAYRKLAMKHHPDRGGSAEKLQQVNEAYDVLKDPTKRKQYDSPSHQGNFNTSNMHNMHNFEDVFSQVFGFGGPRHNSIRKNKDIQIQYNLDFIDIFTGRGVSIAYKLPSGKQQFLDVKIPPGVKDGDVINFAGYGDDTFSNIPKGNLNLKIRIPPNSIWKRTEDNLTTTKKISVFDLLLGTEIVIESPAGNLLNLNVPKGTKPGTTFSIAGHGVPNVNTGRKGNLYIKIDANIPKIEDKDLLDKIEEIKNAIS